MPKDQQSIGPIPQDGEGYEDEDSKNLDGQDGEGDEADDNKEQKPVEKTAAEKELEAVRAELIALKTELRGLKPPEQAKPKEEEEPDWETLMFQDTKAAVKLMKDTITKSITAQLTKSYQEDQGKNKFWDAFYHDHPDLKDDGDLVQTILSANMKDLADLPVKQAGDKLAELTRDRILKYTGGKQRPSGEKKAVVEGAGSSSPPKKKEEESKVITLSDLIKDRRTRRMAGKSTAA